MEVFNRRREIISRMPLHSAYEYLFTKYSEQGGYSTADLIEYAKETQLVPLAIISNNHIRSVEYLRYIIRGLPKPREYKNYVEIFSLAMDIKMKTGIIRGSDFYKTQFKYPDEINELSKLLGFDLLNDRIRFPFPNTTAGVKCNVFLRDVLIDALSSKSFMAVRLIGTIISEEVEVGHNLLCAAILYITNIEHKVRNKDIAEIFCTIVLALILEKTRVYIIKETDFIKTLGGQRDDLLILLCELKCLLGKAPPEENFITKDCEHRLSANNTSYFINDSNIQLLKEVLEEIYTRSVNKFEINDTDTYWRNRWARCKSGAHKIRDEVRSIGKVVTNAEQPTRRNFIENMQRNILFETPPVTYISPSCKNENGKNRAIYSCDTINYLNFDYFIQHIEDNWCNKSIILKPSSYTDHKGHMDIFNSSTGQYFSLDYDDFNSQHSLEAIKAVIRVFSKVFPEQVKDWLIKSVDNMYLSISGKKWYGTLPSGHRLTSFINSILNYAYLRMVLPMHKYTSFHTGDDCIICLPTMRDATEISEILYRRPPENLRINRTKQIVGRVGEFLRHAYWTEGDSRFVRSYFTRSVASLVNGSWTNVVRLEPDEYINAISEILHTMRTRIHSNTIYAMETTVIRRMRLSYDNAYSYLRGTLSINRSPVASTGENVECCDLIISGKNVTKRGGGFFASKDYLNMLERKRPIIFSKIRRFRGFLLKKMADMSLLERREVHEVDFRYYKLNPPYISKVDIADIDLTYRMDGYLSNVMPFPLIKRLLNEHEITSIVKQLNKEFKNYDSDIWGHRANTVFYKDWLSYKDLKVIGHSLCNIIRVYSGEINY